MIWTTSQNSQINTRSSHPVSAGVLSEDVLKNFAKFTQKHLCRSLFFNKVAGWKPKNVRISHWRCSVKQGVFLKRRAGVSEQAFIDPLQNRCSWIKLTGKNLCWSLFLIKLQLWEPATLLKKAPTQVFSCEICKLFKNNYFEETLWTSTSKLYLKRDSNTGVLLWILWISQEHLFCRGSING